MLLGVALLAVGYAALVLVWLALVYAHAER